MPVILPCGQCIGCRLERSRQWAIRCMHEASLHPENCFITLTYADKHLPKDRSLDLTHQQKFFKRLRKLISPKKLRFFSCGEYGDQFGRPHYHACIFGYDFPDRMPLMASRSEYYDTLFRSPTLEKLWPLGISSIGDVTFESAAYVARYITKKITGKNAIDHYNTIDYQTGEILAERRPEYVTMSRRPGIAKLWFEKYSADVFNGDYIILRGKKLKVPKYYNAQYELLAPEKFRKIKFLRELNAHMHSENNTPDRLLVREELQYLKLDQLKRNLK